MHVAGIEDGTCDNHPEKSQVRTEIGCVHERCKKRAADFCTSVVALMTQVLRLLSKAGRPQAPAQGTLAVLTPFG